MGKVDDLRAMREARYAAATRSLKTAAPARSSVATATKPASVKTAAVKTADVTTEPAAAKPAGAKAKAAAKSTLTVLSNPEPDAVEATVGSEPAALFAVPAGAGGVAVEPEPEVELCGHRAISGKTCIRENKHAEKNHKYAKS